MLLGRCHVFGDCEIASSLAVLGIRVAKSAWVPVSLLLQGGDAGGLHVWVSVGAGVLLWCYKLCKMEFGGDECGPRAALQCGESRCI